MITKEKIQSYIEKIPPAPKTLQRTLELLQAGELVQAANVAKQDLALSSYLRDLVNKPIYGFRNEVQDVSQIFGILGVAKSQQAVYNYMISLLSPKKWEFFHMNQKSFYALQAELSVGWQQILKHLEINHVQIQSAVALLPASIIVSEALFCEKKEDVALLRSVSEIDLNMILERLCGMNLFDICEEIAKKWEMDNSISILVQAASGVKPASDDKLNLLGKWMHLLLFYTLSKPQYIEAGLNDFIEFQISYVEEIYEEFSEVMEIA